ncbi:Protein GLUTAMINE DUMPER 5 [Sarracenia purpurea var. burkii]
MTTTKKATFSPPTTLQHSPWSSPVPYLFGGLAAMLGLIAFALLILACSFWKFSNQSENDQGGDRDLENDSESAGAAKASPEFEEKILVIMAGDVKPTFLATPISSRSASSIGDGSEWKRENNDQQEMGHLERRAAAPPAIESRESEAAF